MAQIRPEQRTQTTALRILLATASVATLLCAAPLHAQETALRGPVSEDDINNTLRLYKRRPAAEQAQDQAPAYQPVSPGAIPTQADAEATDLFSEPPNADGTSAGSLPSARPPTTARQRAREARERLAGTAAPTAAERPAVPAADEELTTGTVRQGTVDSETEIENGPEAERQRAIEGRRPQPDANPFEPTGIRFGTFVLKPSLEQGVTATSNADSSFNGKSAVLSETTLRLNAASRLGEPFGDHRRLWQLPKIHLGQEVKDLSGGIDGRLQLDLADDMRALARLGYSMRPESTSSPVVISGTAERPTLHTLNGALGVEKAVGKFRFGVTGEAVDESYSDAELTDGTTLSQKGPRLQTLYRQGPRRLRGLTGVDALWRGRIRPPGL
jgi:hypothetical protein